MINGMMGGMMSGMMDTTMMTGMLLFWLLAAVIVALCVMLAAKRITTPNLAAVPIRHQRFAQDEIDDGAYHSRRSILRHRR
jgi:uncharacterized membrane protein